jgi:protoheme IX farnesyltransferase
MIRDLMVLTKFRINALAMFTGYAAIVVHGEYATNWGMMWPCLLGLLLTGGGANTLNQIFERKKDAVMFRTKKRRPLPAGRISVGMAWAIALLQIIGALFIYAVVYESPMAMACSAFTVLYYSFFYTLYLKPRHYLNVVIGGVPGAMGPLIAWAAVSDGLGHPAPWIMFMLVFLWTPPHAWALAIKLKEDYARAGIPMLPVAKGVDETTRQIFLYTVVLVVASVAMPALSNGFGLRPAYTILALVGGGIFIAWTWRLWRQRPVMGTMPLFAYTLLYIAALFAGFVVDGLMGEGV